MNLCVAVPRSVNGANTNREDSSRKTEERDQQSDEACVFQQRHGVFKTDP